MAVRFLLGKVRGTCEVTGCEGRDREREKNGEKGGRKPRAMWSQDQRPIGEQILNPADTKPTNQRGFSSTSEGGSRRAGHRNLSFLKACVKSMACYRTERALMVKVNVVSSSCKRADSLLS
ncbi:Uncharacterized protein HZ326_22348 [Fusarium oxysporum f. sp. albedinis]|nr:Uncharacterized protein HZ326_22348 [Fusarium oxysporum f. sp. albedinis]